MPTKRSMFSRTVRAQWLGCQMRELRVGRGLVLNEVADYVGVGFSTLARYERAEWPFRRDHVIALLDTYGVFDERDRQKLIKLSENAWRSDHWYQDWAEPDDTNGPVPAWDWILARADEVWVYGPMVLPELVRTSPYAEAILTKPRQASPIDQARPAGHALSKRMYDAQRRIALVTGQDTETRLHVVVEERVLHRRVGSAAVLKAQLEYLQELAKLPNVRIQVVPERIGVHAGVLGGFTVYRMPDLLPSVVCVEHSGGLLLIEAGAERYVRAFSELVELAEADSDSLASISLVKAEL